MASSIDKGELLLILAKMRESFYKAGMATPEHEGSYRSYRLGLSDGFHIASLVAGDLREHLGKNEVAQQLVADPGVVGPQK